MNKDELTEEDLVEKEEHQDRDPDPVDREDATDPGVTGGGGPAAIIYGEDEESEEHGDRLAQDPDDSV